MTVGIRLPGASGEYISTPDHADLAIPYQMGVTWHGSFDSVTPALTNAMIAQFKPSGAIRAWYFALASSGKLVFSKFAIGSATTTTYNSTATLSDVGIIDAQAVRLGVTFDNDGPSVSEVRFWYSTDGITWNQLGDTRTNANVAGIRDGNARLEIGATSHGIGDLLSGVVYSAQVFDGVGANTEPGQGTLVAEYVAEESGTRYRDQTGKVWTCVGSSWATTNDE